MKPIGILLVSTGNLATSMSRLTRMMVGRVSNLKALALKREDHWEDAITKMRRAVTIVNKGRGVLVFADIAGGTPFNVAQALSEDESVEVIGGVNIPMILKAIEVCGKMDLGEAATYLEKYGRDHITKSKSAKKSGESHVG